VIQQPPIAESRDDSQAVSSAVRQNGSDATLQVTAGQLNGHLNFVAATKSAMSSRLCSVRH
jgi:hypothetical protein